MLCVICVICAICVICVICVDVELFLLRCVTCVVALHRDVVLHLLLVATRH